MNRPTFGKLVLRTYIPWSKQSPAPDPPDLFVTGSAAVAQRNAAPSPVLARGVYITEVSGKKGDRAFPGLCVKMRGY
jgi:hypothetical protein